MPRRLRIQFEGAICHVMSRGNARQDIVEDDHDRQQFQELLAAQVARSLREIISFVLMTNYFHVRVTGSAGDSTNPSLALTRDFLHLIWLDTGDGSPQLFYRRAARPVAE